MARFFFNIRTPTGLIDDAEGTELARLGDLRHSAKKVAIDLIQDNPAAADWTFEVRDELGRTVFSEKLKDLV